MLPARQPTPGRHRQRGCQRSPTLKFTYSINTVSYLVVWCLAVLAESQEGTQFTCLFQRFWSQGFWCVVAPRLADRSTPNFLLFSSRHSESFFCTLWAFDKAYRSGTLHHRVSLCLRRAPSRVSSKAFHITSILCKAHPF